MRGNVRFGWLPSMAVPCIFQLLTLLTLVSCATDASSHGKRIVLLNDSYELLVEDFRSTQGIAEAVVPRSSVSDECITLKPSGTNKPTAIELWCGGSKIPRDIVSENEYSVTYLCTQLVSKYRWDDLRNREWYELVSVSDLRGNLLIDRSRCQKHGIAMTRRLAEEFSVDGNEKMANYIEHHFPNAGLRFLIANALPAGAWKCSMCRSEYEAYRMKR